MENSGGAGFIFFFPFLPLHTIFSSTSLLRFHSERGGLRKSVPLGIFLLRDLGDLLVSLNSPHHCRAMKARECATRHSFLLVFSVVLGWMLSSRTKESPSSCLREDDTPPSSSPPPVSLLPPRKTCDKKNVRHYSLARTLHEFMLFTSSSTIPRWTLSLLRASTNCSMRSAMSSTERCTSFRAARWILTGPGGGGTGKLCEFAPLSSF